jgi:hypothetical protein
VTTSKLLIPLSLLIVFPVVSSAVFLSVRPSLIAVGFGSSIQLLSRSFSFRHDGGEGGRSRREKEGEEAGSTRCCMPDPQGQDEAVAQEGDQNSVKKGVHFGTHRSRVSVHASHEALTLHSPVAHPGSPWFTLLARCECLKRHGVGECKGELGADFSLY